MDNFELQDRVDKMKAVAMASGLHNLTPPVKNNEKDENQVAIIESLKVTPRLRDLFLEIRGLIYSEDDKDFVQITMPIMNVDGAFRFVKICQHIAEETEWSNFTEEEINERILAYYEQNYPYFIFWNEEYELQPRDFNYISTTLMAFIDSAFHKSKNSKYLNSVRGMYTEDFVGRVIGNTQKKEGGFLSRLNPFKQK